MASNFKVLREQLTVLFDLVCALTLGLPHLFLELLYIVFPRPKKDIKNDIVLVTGSGQGLGRELALQFAQQGCEIVCVDVNSEPNLMTVKLIHSLGGKARAYLCNVADREAVMKLGKEVGRVDILVNNAGIYPFKSLWNATEEEMRAIININMYSQFWTVQAFLPAMKQRNHGHVVCISSLSGLVGLGYCIPYAVSKFGVAGLMASLSQELQMEKKNVKLTTVFPYFIDTRAEIKECVSVRIPPINVKMAAEIIIKGVRENLNYFTVPRAHGPMLNLLRFLPQAYEAILQDNLSIKITPPKYDAFKELFDSGFMKNTGCIQVQ